MGVKRLADIVKEARANAGFSQDRLAAESNLSKVAIQNIETSRTTKPRMGTLIAMARALGFQTWEEVIASVMPQASPPGHAGRIPILAKIPAGWGNGTEVNGGYNYEDAIDYLPMLPGVTDKQTFALIIDGDSMAPRYGHGEIVVCSPKAWADNGFEDGKRYAIRLTESAGGETTVKRVHRVNDDELDLIPENDRHATRRIKDADIQHAALVRGRYISEGE